jgi:putative peptidoglycan lipid II flippase
LAYGTNLFDWNATVTTGLVLSGYAVGIPIQAALALISRAYYALHDTKTPVMFAIFDVFLTIAIEILCVFVLKLPVWSLALANSLSGFVQISLLYYFLSKKLHNGTFFSLLPILKSIVGGITSGLVMFALLKTFDKSAWIKRLSFINSIDALKNLNFEHFVLDTRYTFNLIVLTTITAIIGILVYIVVLWVLKSEELFVFVRLIRARAFKELEKEEEPVTTTQVE